LERAPAEPAPDRRLPLRSRRALADTRPLAARARRQGHGPRTGRFHEPRWAPTRAQGPWDPPAYQGAYDQHRYARQHGGGADASWYERYGHGRRSLHPGPKGYTRPDERIREEVCERLWEASGLDTRDVEVSVSKGEVTLTGSVPERPMKYAVEDICDHVSGVMEIHGEKLPRTRALAVVPMFSAVVADLAPSRKRAGFFLHRSLT
jgi:hypothetical protein